MRESLIVVGLLVLAVGLRCSRKGIVRKLGALGFLAASYCLFYFLTGNPWGGLIGVAIWFFLPWIELLTRVRNMRLPVENQLEHREIPNPSWFPNAVQAAAAMDEAGFEHVSDCGWDWGGMHQNFRLFWNPEERAVAAICLCEQCDVAFAFITITSIDSQDRIWRTTNFPFAPTLRCPPDVRWNHVPCTRNCFHRILGDHHQYLRARDIPTDSLRVPDPDRIEESIETEMRRQVAHNLATGIVTLTGDGRFRYTTRGLIFLWGQFVKDMVRFC